MDMIKGIAESITYMCKPEDFTLMKDQKNRMVNSGDFNDHGPVSRQVFEDDEDR